MIRLRQACGWCVAAFAAGQCALAQSPPPIASNVPVPQKMFSASMNPPLPPIPRAESPVDLFRKLLAMTPVERENFLTNRPPDIRGRIQAKLREYTALDPNECELRLRATELRWYLLPLLHQSSTNRAAQLAGVPDALRPLVQSRLQRWDILPPPLQQEFFESERALRYFARVGPSNHPSLPLPPPGHGRRPGLPGSNPASARALTEAEREKVAARFNGFFELTATEKAKTLNTLSEAERQQMEKTLETFGKLPAAQRLKCIRAFTEFASMSPEEKKEFLKNAQRWSQMSPQERQTWRDLVTHVPEWPPLPPSLLPPLPPTPPRRPPLVATNPG
jgi:hypothetical protein